MGYGMRQARKKICFILRFHAKVAIGGAELQVLKIAQELVNRKWEVHFISEERGGARENQEDNGISLHWIPERKRGCGFGNYFYLSNLIKEIAPHVVYQRVALDYTEKNHTVARPSKRSHWRQHLRNRLWYRFRYSCNC